MSYGGRNMAEWCDEHGCPQSQCAARHQIPEEDLQPEDFGPGGPDDYPQD